MATTKLQTLIANQMLVQSGSGVPDHDAPRYSSYVDLDNGVEYMNTDGASAWMAKGTSSMGLGGDEDWTTYASGNWFIFWDAANGRQYIGRISGGATTGFVRRSHKVEPNINGTPPNAVSINVRRNNLGGAMILNVYVNGVLDANMDGADINPSAIDVWQTKTFSFAVDPRAGDEISIALECVASGAAQTHDLNMVEIKYNN